ncbi:MAG: PIG-L family deacetylase [Rhodospirillales bacterium]|nr:PIG-L family deacetylase [Rhodospirillales bacterium]
MSADASRLEAEAAADRTWGLELALRGLPGVLSFLQVGAHPDDETSGLLAMLVRRHAVSVGYACATRGEGGQNALGPERNAALGALRTDEMEAAAARLGISIHWLAEPGDEALRDFGFSKSAEDTLRRWGHAHALERLVRCIRRVRPDILCTTFRDVGGQHGHHRAISRLTAEAFRIAGDAVWAPSLLYEPAWSGADGSYDDETPSLAGHVVFDTGECDPANGVPYARIGEWSRACHRTQEMGRWIEAGAREVSLRLVARNDGATVIANRLGQSLPATLRELADATGIAALGAVQDLVEQARADMPDRAAVRRYLEEARKVLATIRAPEPLAGRLARKGAQLRAAICLAAEDSGRCPMPAIRPPAPSVVRDVPSNGIARPTGTHVAYLGGGLDTIAEWIAALGIDVVDMRDLDPAALAHGGFTTVLVGIRAFERRADLCANVAVLHDFVRAGGHLVTMYHRGGGSWLPDRMPLARIEIGRPSIRWRACDPGAPVEIAIPDHPLMNFPNRIGPADWWGWQRERGLYFASAWDPAYEPLLRVTDPGEAPHAGSVLSGRFGKGRHTHVALALHNEIEFGTLGALRLLCNFVAPA